MREGEGEEKRMKEGEGDTHHVIYKDALLAVL